MHSLILTHTTINRSRQYRKGVQPMHFLSINAFTPLVLHFEMLIMLETAHLLILEKNTVTDVLSEIMLLI